MCTQAAHGPDSFLRPLLPPFNPTEDEKSGPPSDQWIPEDPGLSGPSDLSAGGEPCATDPTEAFCNRGTDLT